MIYLFYGSDEVGAREKWRRVIAAFAAKNPSGSIFHFDAEHFEASQFEELAVSQDLFGGKRLVVGDRLLENDEALTMVSKRLKELVPTATVFALLEHELPAALLKKIELAGGKIEAHEKKGKAAGPSFNPFALSDALAARDRKRLWLLYHEALVAGLAAEEIFWKLGWQIKTLLLIQNSKTAPKSLKPFVLEKSRRALKNFKPGELEQLSGQLMALWHEARRGQADFDIGLEKLVLSI